MTTTSEKFRETHHASTVEAGQNERTTSRCMEASSSRWIGSSINEGAVDRENLRENFALLPISPFADVPPLRFFEDEDKSDGKAQPSRFQAKKKIESEDRRLKTCKATSLSCNNTSFLFACT